MKVKYPHRLQALEDKPKMYQLLYRTEYVKETKRMRTKESIGSYILGIALTVVILVALGSTT